MGRPTNHSSSQKTWLNDLSYGIKIWTDLSSVLSQSTRLTDRQTDTFLIASLCRHSMQRGKVTNKTTTNWKNFFRSRLKLFMRVVLYFITFTPKIQNAQNFLTSVLDTDKSSLTRLSYQLIILLNTVSCLVLL